MRNWFYIGLTFLLVTATLIFWDAPPEQLIPLRDETAPALFPYAMIQNAHSRHFDESGVLSYEFVANSLHHYRIDLNRVGDEDFTSMEAPQVTLWSEQQPWFVTAKMGKITDQGNVITLWNDVRIWQTGEEDEATELITERLVIQPQEQIITTDREVTLTSPQGRLQAVGMIVDLNTQHIQLLNRVRGLHEPI